MGIYCDRLFCDGYDWLENEPQKRRFVDSPEKIINQSLFGLWEVVTDHHGALIEVNLVKLGSRYEARLKTSCGANVAVNQACLKCNSTGWYTAPKQVGTIHSLKCDLCCPHDMGRWLLSENYADAGKWCCLGGCGTTWDTETGE